MTRTSRDLAWLYEFDANDYERVGDAWICGRAAEGTPCAAGPSKSGSCRGACSPIAEDDGFACGGLSMLGGRCDDGPTEDGACCHNPPQCKPVKKKGAWICTRGQCKSGPTAEGACGQAGAVCQPTRRVMPRRRAVTACAFALALGGMLILASLPGRNAVISPGQLSSAHGSLANQCSACHQAADGNLLELVNFAFAETTALNQSQHKCLACHEELGPHALSPHAMDPSALATLTGDALSRLSEERTESFGGVFAKTVFGDPMAGDAQLACATCHQEHHGAEFDLKAIADQNCQTCHAQMFTSFQRGHPPFPDQFPAVRRKRINFNHAAHYRQYFPDAARIMPSGQLPTACATCHQQDGGGRMMLTASFETSCASCHADQVTDTAVRGIALFAAPALDVATLESKQVAIGSWPNMAGRGDATGPGGKLPPLMELLLSTDADFVQSRDVVHAMNVRVLQDATPEQLEAVSQYAWSIKRLMHELATQQSAAIEQRLQSSLGESDNAGDAPRWRRLLSETSFARAAAAWMPTLAADLAAAESGQPPPSAATDVARPAVPTASRGIYRDDRDLSIRLRARGHADPLMRAWLEAAAAMAATDSTGDANSNTDFDNAQADLFFKLTNAGAAGRCMKCHTLDIADEDVAGETVLNWHAARPKPESRLFTRFVHAPHLVGAEDADCAQCHQWRPDGTRYDPSYFSPDWRIRTDPHRFRNDFLELPESKCAECHGADSAPNSCTTCHNYHVRGRSW